jgi:hypothetical protein
VRFHPPRLVGNHFGWPASFAIAAFASSIKQ